MNKIELEKWVQMIIFKNWVLCDGDGFIFEKEATKEIVKLIKNNYRRRKYNANLPNVQK